MNDVSARSVSCAGCNRKFKSDAALQQHVRDRKDAAHTTVPVEGDKTPKKVVRAKSIAPTPKAPNTQSSPVKAKKFKDGWLFQGTGTPLLSIQSSQVQPGDVAVTSDGGYELLCSYNWVIKPQPTVYVPGEPPRLVSKSLPMRISPDSGVHYIDQNSFRVPKYPFEVVFQAMNVMNPAVKFSDVDVLTNRNSLRHLLDFCRGKCIDSFRIDLYLIQNTLVIERRERSTKEMIRGSGNSGFGHSFEEAVTEPPPGMADIAGHHRVLRYDLGGLTCAVRFEVDAVHVIPEAEGGSQSPEAPPGSSVDQLAQSLENVAVGSSRKTPSSPGARSVQVITRGTAPPQTQAAEIKSIRRNGKPLSTMLPQLWFGRTPYLVRGYHDDGNFTMIRNENVEENLKDWEVKDQNQMALRGVVSLLGQLREVVGNSETKSCIAVCLSEKPLKLRVFSTAQKKLPLPEKVIERFWEKD
ncbi:C2H2-type domain-containing protein [Fusarium sp. LHS14.1]|nr:C2H2-type domain-containing protein [Fusarium sp. LHS14.1]